MTEDVEFLPYGREPMRVGHAFEAGLRGLLRTHRFQSNGDMHELRYRAISQ